MRRFVRAPVSFAITLALLLVAGVASADPSQGYSEARVEGGQVVTFGNDDLRGGGPSALGDTIRKPPGAVRVGLIRPRYNFVPELLKSVENL